MANKDGIVSIGFDYKKELDEVCATIEKELNNLGGDINLSDGIKKQMAEVKKMITDMKKDIGSSFDKITETKLDTKTFESFKKDVNKRIREINKEVTTLKEQFSTLDGSANVNGIVQQFANLKKHVEDSNASISEFINNSEKLGKSVIISPSLDTDSFKNEIAEIKSLLSRLGKEDFDFGYSNKSAKELGEIARELVFDYRDLSEEIEETKSKLNSMNNSDKGFKEQEAHLSKLSLELIECGRKIDDVFGSENSQKVDWEKYLNINEIDEISKYVAKKTGEIRANAQKIIDSIATSNNITSTNKNNRLDNTNRSNNIEVHISTKQSTINKQLDEMIDNLQQRAANKPIIAPVKLRVDSEYEKTTKDASASALTENQINEARKDVESVVPGLEKAFNNSMRIATNKAVENAKESIKAVREFFKTNPITVHLTIPEDERLKIGKSILSEDGKTTVDISGQVDKARKSVKGLSEDLEKSQLLIKENAQNAKNLSLEKLVNSLSETMTQFSELKGIISSIQNMENTIARVSGISSTNELVEQWSVVEKTIINATKLDGDFRKNANIGKIISEYQKYIDMGGTNALSSIDKIKDNETTINSILSKMKELKSQDIENSSIQKLSVDLDGVIAKFDELISTVKTATNALYKIIKQGSISDLDKQWSSISNKFKTIADESGKINLSKQKTDIKELMDMYQRYENAGGTNSLMSLTDNVETLRKLDKEYQKLNQTQSVDNSFTIEKESESFKSVEKSVDSLTTAIGDTKVQAINVEVTAMEDAAEREIMAIRSILDNLDLVVSRLKDIKGIKLPKIEVKNIDVVEKAVESLENTGNKSNISSENTVPLEQVKDSLKDIEQQAKETSEALNTVYHFSKIPFEKFDESRIGEHATVYGKGAYFFFNKDDAIQSVGEMQRVITEWTTDINKIYKDSLGLSEKEIKIIFEEYKDVILDSEKNMTYELFKTRVIPENGNTNFDWIEALTEEDINNVLSKLGYAGRTISGERGFVLFDPANAKRANENITYLNQEIDSAKEAAKSEHVLAEARKEANSTETPMKDVFQGGTTSAEKLEEGIKNIDSATEKASESAKEYGKILSQVGLVGKQFDEDGNQIPSKYSYTRQTGENQIQTITVKYEQDKESGEIVEKEIIGDYITGFQALEKEIDKADKKVFDLKKTLESNKVKLGDNYDSSALETLISNAENEANMLYDTLLKVYDAESEYEYSIAQYADERAKKQSEYNTQLQNAKNIDDARAKNASDKKNESDEKKRLANIEQVNRALNKQQITIDAIEKTYNKTTNPDLDREVSNQQDLAELSQKKLAIQTKINSLQGQERNSANEKEFLELEKLIAEYKELAKYKLKANNPSKQELGGQNLQTLIQEQIYKYDRLITKAEKYGDATSETVEKLKEQKDILSKMGSDGKYSATADQYYASRDTYKVESAALSAFDAETRAIEQKTQAVKKLSDELKAYNKQVPKKLADGQRSDKFEGLIQNYKNAIGEAQKYLNNLGDAPVTEEIKKEWENLIGVIKKAKEEMDSIPTAERGSDALSRGKEIDTITKYLNKFTGISKQAKRELNGLLDQLQSGDPSVNVKKIHERFLELTVAERNAGREARNLFDIFKDKKIYSFIGQAASMFSFYDLVNVARQAGQAVIDLNTNITELAKVSEASASQIYDDFNSYADIAKEVGGTISDTISATADWSRNGYNIPDAKELAEVAMIYKNVGDGIDIDQANEYLISTLRGFSLEAKDAMNIIDSINEVANNEPISSAGIGEALQRSAAAFNVANTSLQESIALVTSTNSVLQSPEKVGSMWTTVSARIRGAKAELEDAGLETDGMVESTSKLQAMIKGMSGFDILEDDQKTFKSIYDIIIGIGEEFQNLSGVDQAALLEALAGKRQSNALAATLNNIDLLKKAYGEATNAEGSAMAEQEKYQQSIQYSIDRTKASLEELANDFISSDFLKGLIDFGDKLINILDLLIDKFGVLGTTAIIGGGILGGKNLGKTYEYTVFKLNCFEYALYA